MEFKDNSNKVKKKIERQAIKALEQACILVQGQAILLAPKDTGNLSQHIDYKIDRGELVGYVGTNVDYALYLEYGTGEFASNGSGRKGGWLYKDSNGKTRFTYGNKPQPYMKPAFRRNKKQVIAIFEEFLRLVEE